MQIKDILHVAIRTMDLDATRKFYVEVLGLKGRPSLRNTNTKGPCHAGLRPRLRLRLRPWRKRLLDDLGRSGIDYPPYREPL
jgi:hypothetical protein